MKRCVTLSVGIHDDDRNLTEKIAGTITRNWPHTLLEREKNRTQKFHMLPDRTVAEHNSGPSYFCCVYPAHQLGVCVWLVCVCVWEWVCSSVCTRSLVSRSDIFSRVCACMRRVSTIQTRTNLSVWILLFHYQNMHPTKNWIGEAMDELATLFSQSRFTKFIYFLLSCWSNMDEVWHSSIV